jgi:hypothetical protein
VSDANNTVSFRLADSYARLLEAKVADFNAARGRGKDKLSRHELARHLLMQALDQEQGHELSEQLNELRLELSNLTEAVSQLRGDLATATTGLLIHAGKTEPEHAQRWVRQRLLQA